MFAAGCLLLAALLSSAGARAQTVTYTIEFRDVTSIFESVAAGTVLTQPNFAVNALTDIASAGSLSFDEGDLRIYEFVAFEGASGRPTADVRVELMGAGASAYRLSVGAVESGNPAIPLEPSLSAKTLTLSSSSNSGDLLGIRAQWDADSANPAAATLRISRVSGDAFSNLPLEFSLTTQDTGQVPSLEVTDLRLARKLEHDTSSRITFSAKVSGAGVDAGSGFNVAAVCMKKDVAENCGTAEFLETSSGGKITGFYVTPVLDYPHSYKYGSSLSLTISYYYPPSEATLTATLSAEDLVADSPIQDFDVLPIPIEVYFRQREYSVAEDVINADLGIASDPERRRNIYEPGTSTHLSWLVRVEFGGSMRARADWPISITPSEPFAELEFNSVTTQLLYPVPITPDSTYKPRETMDLSIVSVRFEDDGSPARYNSDPGHAKATIIVRDLDTVDVQISLHRTLPTGFSESVATDSLQVAENDDDAAGYLRFYMTETDGGAVYYDTAGGPSAYYDTESGVGTLTLTLSSTGSGGLGLCPEDLSDFVVTAAELCVRSVNDDVYGEYKLSDGGSGVIHLTYLRNGRHDDFWVEIIVPEDEFAEDEARVTFALTPSVGDNAFVEGDSVAVGVTITASVRPPLQIGFVERMYTFLENQIEGTIQLELSDSLTVDDPFIEVKVLFGEKSRKFATSRLEHHSWSSAMNFDGTSMTATFMPGGSSVVSLDVGIDDDVVNEFGETMDVRIDAISIGGDRLFREVTIGTHQVTTLNVLDDDFVTADVEILASSDSTTRHGAATELLMQERRYDESPIAGYIRFSRWHSDSSPNYDFHPDGGESEVTIGFTGMVATAPAAPLCPDNLRDLSGDFCVRAHADAPYTLSNGGTGQFVLNYDRDGLHHQFYIEVLAPVDGMTEADEGFTLTLTDIVPSDDLVQLGLASGSGQIVASTDLDDLSYSIAYVYPGKTPKIDSAANVGVENRVKIADIDIRDGGSDGLRSRISEVLIETDLEQPNLAFMLTTPDGVALSYPRNYDDGAVMRWALYAYIPSARAAHITDEQAVAVTLDIQATEEENGELFSRVLSTDDAPTGVPVSSYTQTVEHQVVGTQIVFDFDETFGFTDQFLEPSGQTRGQWWISDIGGTADLHIAVALRDAHGNADLIESNAINTQIAFSSEGRPSSADAIGEIPAGFYHPSVWVVTPVSGGVFRIVVGLDDFNDNADFKNLPDGSELKAHVGSAFISEGVTELPLSIEINYIADRIAVVTPTFSVSPAAPLAASPLTLMGDFSLRAYNLWSGQNDLHGAPGDDGDLSQSIAAGLSCDYAVSGSGEALCEAININAVLNDDGDGVWTMSNPQLTVVLPAGAAAPASGGAGEFHLHVAVPWTAAERADLNLPGHPVAWLSSQSFTARVVTVAGFASATLSVTEGDVAGGTLAEICAQSSRAAAAALVLPFSVDAGATAREGEDYRFSATEITIAAGASRGCVNLLDGGGKVPENTKHLRLIPAQARWSSTSSDELLTSLAPLAIEIEDDDLIRIRVDTGRMVGGVYTASTTLTEQPRNEEGFVDDPLLLRISLWTDETPPRPFYDNLGGERRLYSVSLSQVAGGAVISVNYQASCGNSQYDVCARLPAPSEDSTLEIVALRTLIVSKYRRNGQHEFFTELAAFADGEVEGEETFSVGRSVLGQTVSGINVGKYISDDPGIFAVRVIDGERPEVRYFLAATGERVSSLNVLEGAAPATSFYAGIYDKNTGAALALKEEFSFELLILDAAGSVISVTAGDGTAIDPSTGALILTFPVGVATTPTFSLQAAEDADSMSEQGMLDYLHRSGAANIEHAANFPVIAVDNDDGISPSACVGVIDSIDDLPAESARDAAQANCLRSTDIAAYGFSLEWDAARDRQALDETALTALSNDNPYRIYLSEKGDGQCATPTRPPPRQTQNGLDGGAVPALAADARPDNYPLAVPAVADLGVTVAFNITDADGGSARLKVSTAYCVLLGVSDGAWMDWAPAIEVRTAAYSPADADGNGVPDDLEFGLPTPYTDLEQYLYCTDDRGVSRADCDNDGVPDAVELRVARAEEVDNLGFTELNCRANGLRTRLAAALSSLDCSIGGGGDASVADVVAAIDAETLVHVADNKAPDGDPSQVAVNIADPQTLGDGAYYSGRYWLSAGEGELTRLDLQPAVDFSAPETMRLIDGAAASMPVRARLLGPRAGARLALPVRLRLTHVTTPHALVIDSYEFDLRAFEITPPDVGGGIGEAAARFPLNYRFTSVEAVRLEAAWRDGVGAGTVTLTQDIRLLPAANTTPTQSAITRSLTLSGVSFSGVGLNRFSADTNVLSLGSLTTDLPSLVFQRPNNPPAETLPASNKWTLMLSEADAAPRHFSDDSTETRLVGVDLTAASLMLPIETLGLSSLPARLVVNWSSECSPGATCFGARMAILIVAAVAATQQVTTQATEALQGYEVGGHYRDDAPAETAAPAREVTPEPGVKIRLGELAAQRCLSEPDVCSGREMEADQGLRLNDDHPACRALGDLSALPCLDFQLFCAEGNENCLREAAVDVVFPLTAPLRGDYWLYYSRPAADGGYLRCPFVQNDLPAHVRPVAGCPGVDQTPAFIEAVYLDRIYAAPDSDAAACPTVSDPSWRPLAELQSQGADLSTANCLRVAYADNGPNDAAPEVGLIADPMTVGTPSGAAGGGFDPLAGNFGSGGGALGVFALLALALLTLISLISLPSRSTNISPPASAGGDVAAKRRQRGGLTTTLAVLLALALGAAPQARAADWKVFDDAAEFFGEVFSGDFFTEGAWATGLDLALSGFDRDIGGVQEDADDNDYGFRLRGHWDQDGVWGEGLAAELWWADLGSAALRPDGGGEEVDFDYEAYGLGLTWGWALPRFDWLSIGGFDLNPNHVFAGGGWRDIDVADADGDGVYFTTGLSWNVGEWFNAPGEEWSLRVSYDVFDSEGVDYFAIGLTHRFGAAQARPAASRAEVRKRLPRRARRGALASCGEWDSCACQRPINANARGWYVQVATYSDNGLAVARKRMRQLREAGYREVGLRDNGRGLHALRVSVRGDCREAEALKGRLDALLNVDSMLRGWKDRPY